MLNQIVLVGRLVKEVEVKELESGKKVANITLAVPRAFKNIDGEYETDFISCTLWESVAQNTKEYCKKGDIVGIKGRLQNDNIVDNDGNIIGRTNVVIAEKVTFLSSKKEEDKNE